MSDSASRCIGVSQRPWGQEVIDAGEDSAQSVAAEYKRALSCAPRIAHNTNYSAIDNAMGS